MANDERAEASRASPGLAALLFIEACGFVELFETDEGRALDLLGAYRSCAEPIIAERGGELVDATGSELLAAFPSAVAATQCVMHLGLALRPELRRAPELDLRAGLQLGEIWRGDKRVYGNGVNVAARVMQAAPPGAAYLSEDIHRQIETMLDLRMRPVPPLAMKNIARSLALYELDWGAGFVEAAPAEARVAQALSKHADILAERGRAEPCEPQRPRGGPGDGAALAAAPRPPLSLETRRERASAQLSGAIRGLIMNAGLGAVFGYAFYTSDKPIYLVGLTILGLFPALSALRKAMRVGDELRAIAREERSSDRAKDPSTRPTRRRSPPR